MKKVLLSAAVLAAFTVSAQNDTITEFFTGTPVVYNSAASAGGGYVSGNNGYGDLTKSMRFDATTLPASGTLDGVLMWIPVKSDNGGSFSVKVNDWTGTTIGTQLDNQTFTIASVDTAITAFSLAEGTTPYNFAVTFATPITLTAATDVLISVVLPTTAGDTIVLVSNTDGDYADALDYTWEEWSDNTWHSFGDPNNWNLGIAMGMFPVVTSTVSVDELVAEVSTYPNPANDVLNFKSVEEIANVTLTSLEGKVVAMTTGNQVNVSELATGVYVYEVTTVTGKTARNTFMKK